MALLKNTPIICRECREPFYDAKSSRHRVFCSVACKYAGMRREHYKEPGFKSRDDRRSCKRRTEEEKALGITFKVLRCEAAQRFKPIVWLMLQTKRWF